MINFKSYLIEGRDAPLYHATDIDSLKGILKTNTLRRGWEQPNHNIAKDHRTISLTRDFEFAKKWNTYDAAIIQFDQRRLAQRYKIVPFNYFPKVTRRHPGFNNQSGHKQNYHFENQYEEAIINQDVKNVKSYITAIYSNYLEELKDYFEPHEFELFDLRKKRIAYEDL